jgi:AmmeMemoRadiSam system protein B
VQTDRSLLGALRRGPLEVDRLAHAREHSIEVELPFLQYVHPRPQFVALGVSFGPLAFLLDVAAIVRGALAGRDVLVIASTDFSHYIPAERARTLDRHAIDPILARNAEGLYRAVVDEELTMCGIAPTTVLLAALEAEPLEARLLRWGHSGEAEPMREVVGYAAISFESESPLR